MSAGWLGQAPYAERERLEAELAAAGVELAAYRATMALLRPYMDGTGRTLAEAIAAIREDGIEPGPLPPMPEARA